MRRRSCRIPPATTLLTTTVAILLVCASVGLADVYTYECDSLPTSPSAGWTLFWASEGTQQWITDGLLFQEVPLCESGRGCGTVISHYKNIENLEGLTSWFVEWRLMTTGISEEIPWTAPTALVVASGGGLVYHFTIADDRVRFLRDFDLPTLFFEITPSTMHTFRVEIFGPDLGETYIVYIDGAVVDSGEVEGPFYNPPWQAEAIFRAKSKFVPSVATWDYIRWGEIPLPGTGDLTRDGNVDFEDLPFFHECLTTEAGGWAGCEWADMDLDGDTDCDDWSLFLEAWTDPAGPPCTPTCGDCDPADLNHDGQVGAFDLALLLGSWGPCPDPPAECPADLDGNASVGASDLAILLGSWG